MLQRILLMLAGVVLFSSSFLVGSVGSLGDFAWTTKTASLSLPRSHLAGASVGDVALFGGGRTTGALSSATDRVDIYHASNASWTIASLSLARSSLVATSVGNLAFFAGGILPNGSVSDRVDIFNVSDHSWRTYKLTEARWSIGVTSVRGMALFGGGRTATGYSSAVDTYHVANNSWTVMHLSLARAHLSAAAAGELALFALGQQSGPSNVGDVDVFNATSGSWSKTSIASARHYAMPFSFNNIGCFAGGRTSANFYQVNCYNATSGSWATSLSLIERRDTGATATVVNTAAVVAGGQAWDSSIAYDTVEIYVAKNHSLIPGPPLSQARWGLAGAAVGNLALFAGGSANVTTVSSVVDIYNFTFIPIPTPSPSPITLAPVLQINNATGLDVLITPKDSAIPEILQSNYTLGLGFGSTIKELDGDDTVLQEGLPTVQSTWKQANDTRLGSSLSYVFSATLAIREGNALNETSAEARMEVQFYLFDDPTIVVPYDSTNTSMVIDPSLAKFTIRLFNWPWKKDDSMLEMRIKLTPSISGCVRLDRYTDPSSHITSFLLHQFADSNRAQSVLNLLDTAMFDDEAVYAGERFSFSVDTTRSELVLRFAHFNSSLVYDPDVGVLFSAGSSAESSTPIGLIVGVSVGVGCAVLVVALVIIGAIVGERLRRKRARTKAASASSRVNFTYDDFSKALPEADLYELQSRSPDRPRSLSKSSALASSLYKE